MAYIPLVSVIFVLFCVIQVTEGDEEIINLDKKLCPTTDISSLASLLRKRNYHPNEEKSYKIKWRGKETGPILCAIYFLGKDDSFNKYKVCVKVEDVYFERPEIKLTYEEGIEMQTKKKYTAGDDKPGEFCGSEDTFVGITLYTGGKDSGPVDSSYITLKVTAIKTADTAATIGAIVGGVLGGIAVLIILIVICIVLACRRKRYAGQVIKGTEPPTNQAGQAVAYTSPPSGDQKQLLGFPQQPIGHLQHGYGYPVGQPMASAPPTGQ